MHFKTGHGYSLFLVVFSFIAGQIHMGQISNCEKGWPTFRRSCYYFSTSPVTFRQALLACYLMGAELLELQNAMEEKWIDHQIRLREGNSTSIWLGASDVQKEGKFISVSKAEGLRYNHWVKNEPNDYQGREDCATYKVSHRGMNDEPCIRKFKYVCKK